MNSPTKPAILEFAEVSYHHPAHEAPLLERITFTVAPGEAVALTGPFGSGKSTALELILGARHATSGEVLVIGRDPAALNPEELAHLRTRIGYVAQHGALLGNLSLLDNLSLPLRYHRTIGEAEIKRTIGAACELVDLELNDIPAVQPAMASLEMRQLVALARALVLDAPVLVLDEPGAGLGGNAAREYWRLFAQLRTRRDLAILIATNDVATAHAVADRSIALPPRHHTLRQPRNAIS